MAEITKKKIVIVGGGMFGTALIAKFRDAPVSAVANIYITLIEPRDDFIYMPLSIRNCIEDVTDEFVKPYDKLFARRPSLGEVKKGLVVGVDQSRKIVQLESGEEMQYDVLVLSTGTIYNNPSKIPLTSHDEIVKYLTAQRDLIADSYHIIIIGAGTTGCELAAEIADRFRSKKKVTIIHSQSLPLSDIYCIKLRQLVLTYLLQSRVEVLLKSRATPHEDGSVTIVRQGRNGEEPTTETREGNTIILANSARPCTDMFPFEWKNEKGFVKVKPTLQLTEDDSIFAIGDITDMPDAKTGFKTQQAIPVAYANIMALLKEKTLNKQYIPQPESVALQMGKWRATGQTHLPLIGPVLLPQFVLSAVLKEDVGAKRGVKAVGY
ncbi:hypothetical protein V1512DRAFT_127772 [Lipomyces arxii]|uniref:uncharacterized protein n=1 Tax=Lipomyces arxii TaxID=56418 RepID=UPI0034CFAA28